MATRIDAALVNLKKQLDGIEDRKQRIAVIKALQRLRNEVNAELLKIRPTSRRGTAVTVGPPWVKVPRWV